MSFIVTGLGVFVLCLQYIAGQLITYVRPMDKISGSQRKNKNRIDISFIFCLSLLFLHTRMSKCICCFLIYMKLSCRNIHYSFIASKTHWKRGIKHLANIHLCGPNGIFKFYVYKNSFENKGRLASDLGENLSNTSWYNERSGLCLRQWIV